MALAGSELYSIFDARRVKAPELKGLDLPVNSLVGYVMNRRPMLKRLQETAVRVEKLEPTIKDYSVAKFREVVTELQSLAKTNRLEGEALDLALAVTREAAWRSLGKRPYPVQIMGAAAMQQNLIAEMATGEGKTLTAAVAASIIGLAGRPVHVITVNDYLVQRDADNMKPLYEMMGLKVGCIVHELEHRERPETYRRNVVYTTSKELVADFLRDQISLGNMRTSAQTALNLLMSDMSRRGKLMVPGLFRCIVDEADSLLIDEAVTPLIISNSPDGNPNETLYRAAQELAGYLAEGKDFIIDKQVRTVDLTPRGQDRLEEIADGLPEHQGFWSGRRRREELVTQALVSRHCFHRDEHYLIDSEGKVQIIDEFTGRVMADRSWRHGLHQAIEIKEGVKVTADKENLAAMSFQRFFRQYPLLAGMTGTAWEAAGEIWDIYRRAIVRIPTHKPCIRVQLPLRFFDTQAEKWNAVVARIIELNDRGVPILVGTRSVGASEEVSRRLAAAGRAHRVLNAAQNAEEAAIITEAGLAGKITVATNMAGRGTDILLGKGVAELGGLHVISTEANSSGRVDRQLFGRAARQGDPGCAQLFAAADDDLFMRHAKMFRNHWRTIGPQRLIRVAQATAERIARFNRKMVLKNDDWMDSSMPF